jgi:hypothetical protein
MDKLIEAGQWLVVHGPEVVSAVVALLSGVIAIALIIPGEQPEKALQSVVDFLKKFSKKSE